MARLRVLSANLLVDRADPEAFRALIAHHRPDVVAVQELGHRNAPAIREVLPHGHLDPRRDAFGLGIATNRPVDVVKLPLVGRDGWVARLDAGDWDLARTVRIVDIHLRNPVKFPWWRTQRTRRMQVDQVAEAVGGFDDPYVIVGDMNTTWMWPEYRALSRLGVDAARTTDTAEATWNHFLIGPRLIRIDHAFASGVEPVTTRTLRVLGSDHRALVVDLDV